jgi:hypothetical protein
MTAILNAGWKFKIWQMNICKDTRGQDLTEYALMAGFLAAACAATRHQHHLHPVESGGFADIHRPHNGSRRLIRPPLPSSWGR